MMVSFTIISLSLCLVELLCLELRGIYVFWIKILGLFCVFGLDLVFGTRMIQSPCRKWRWVVGGQDLISRFYFVMNVLEYLDLKIWTELPIIL